jgi:hypothetical protein
VDYSLTKKVLLGLPSRNELISYLRNILSRFLYEDFIPEHRLGDEISSFEGDEKEAFLDLAEGMLAWHPDARKTAGELSRHHFLQPKQTSSWFW